jgi:hypothetical protein
MSYYVEPSTTSGITFADVRELQRAAWYVYQHDHAEWIYRLLVHRFDDHTAEFYKMFTNPVQNPLRRIAQLLSVTYTTPTYRTSGYAATDRAIRRFVRGLDPALEKAEEYKNATGDAFVIPYWSVAEKCVRFHVVSPSYCDVETDETGGIIAYIYNDKRLLPDGTYQEKDKRGDWGSSQDSGLDVAPIAWFRLDPYSELIWSANEIKDLVLGTLEIGLSESINNVGEHFRAYKQPFLSGPSDGTAPKRAAAGMRLGQDIILEREIGTVDLADPTNPQYDAIRKKISDLAATRGISDKTYFAQARISNAEDAAVFTPELRNRWRKSIKYQLDPERQLLTAVVGLINKWNGSDLKIRPDGYVIDYREPIPELESPGAALNVLKLGVESGVDSAVEYVMRHDQEVVTREDAMEKIKMYAEDTAEVNRLYIEHNIPRGELGKGLTPQENGRIGGQISGEVRGEYDGSGGPPMIPKDNKLDT